MQDNCARLAGSWCGLILRFGAIALFLFASVAPSYAGSFIFAGEANGVDVITHPTGYTGTGGNLTVTVGIDPNSPNANEMETPVRNLINVLNGLNPTDGNLVFGAANNIPSNNIDFESVALHEVGHCIGLGHVNLASESGFVDPQRNYTESTDGANSTFDVDPGADGIIGSGGNAHVVPGWHASLSVVSSPIRALSPLRSALCNFSSAIIGENLRLRYWKVIRPR